MSDTSRVFGLVLYLMVGGAGIFPFNWKFGWYASGTLMMILIGPLRFWKGTIHG